MKLRATGLAFVSFLALFATVACQKAQPPEPRIAHTAWQAKVGSFPEIAGNRIIAVGDFGVSAWSLRTGRRLWVATDSNFLGVFGFRVCGSVIAAYIGDPARAAYPTQFATAHELDGLDLRTGRRLWSRRLAGEDQVLGLACTARVVVFANRNGGIVAVRPRSGRTRWVAEAPATCPPRDRRISASDVAVAIEAGVVGVNRRCHYGFAATVQALDERTGRQRWLVDTPGDPPGQDLLFQFDGPRDSGIFLARSRVPKHVNVEAKRWAPSGQDIAMDEYDSQLEALDIGSGKLRWREVAPPADTFVSGGKGIVCLLGQLTYECRESLNGHLLTAQSNPHKGSPFGDTRAAAVVDGYAFELRVQNGRDYFITRSIATGRVLRTLPLRITEKPLPGADDGAGISAATSRVVLIRRNDVAGYPIYALI